MTVKELQEYFAHDDIVDCEVYYTYGNKNSFHSDCLIQNKEPSSDDIVNDYQLMSEQDYNHTVMANTCETIDFNDVYGNPDGQILVILAIQP